MECELNAGLDTLPAQVEHPVKVKRTSIFARLTANAYLLYQPRVKIVP